MSKKPYRKEPRYISIITVRVSSTGAALDMMRYDSCWPATEDDSRKLERLMGDAATRDDYFIKFFRASRTDSLPTMGRWESFGCKVLDVRAPDDEPFRHPL